MCKSNLHSIKQAQKLPTSFIFNIIENDDIAFCAKAYDVIMKILQDRKVITSIEPDNQLEH